MKRKILLSHAITTMVRAGSLERLIISVPYMEKMNAELVRKMSMVTSKSVASNDFLSMTS